MQALVRHERELRRQHTARLREQAQQVRAAERARKESVRHRAAQEREEARQYVQSRAAEADDENQELQKRIGILQGILVDSLGVNPHIPLGSLKTRFQEEPSTPPPLALPAPVLASYLPPPLTWVEKLIPGAKAGFELKVSEARRRFEADTQEHGRKERARQDWIEELRLQRESRMNEERRRVEAQHQEIDALSAALKGRDPVAVTGYLTLVLERSPYPEGFPDEFRMAYVRESKQLVIEVQLPGFEIVPEVGSYRFIKSKDDVVESPRPMKERRALYASVIAQKSLRLLREIFVSDRFDLVDTIVLNGHVDAVDRSTGQRVNPCLVTVRTSRDVFSRIDLRNVDPEACLRGLHASVSKSPEELAPVRPVLEFSMVDPRFVEEMDVLSGLDQRPNLMDLSPGEFESLITNLFAKMGLESRQTRASRDGGVDCVAYDPRPIFGGKVVIQAKRYKNTVGVGAVRDLFGTLQNEGASKGILVTTSGYGRAAFEFAQGKPIELLSGSNLLHLLAEHAGVDAKIVVPDDWKDPSPDSGE